MAESKGFRLPAASLDELFKVVKAYAASGKKAVGATDLANLLGVQRTRVSGSNGFLVDSGIVAGGQKKMATPIGLELGRALELQLVDEAVSAVQDLVRASSFLSDVITHVRLKGAVKSEDLVKQVILLSGQRRTSGNETGARTVVDLLQFAGYLEESDGQLSVARPIEAQDTSAQSHPASTPVDDHSGHQGSAQQVVGVPIATASAEHRSGLAITIAINLQLPETEKPEVYENLFRALREHLLEHGA